ncbi:MAG: SAM-dependent methyltransferase [Hyphomonas sp.]|uniref:class I SAM-dependent methyltransferase n=1 Tax=Hyphomonas sp. TaxID=87 RepID=UPI001DE726D1|nr:class I SAM-dependent methyltransferase [Hyphomonas sp.]MBA4226944.1 SAM-dependent methyltransferase [Hyphomonas sp.]
MTHVSKNTRFWDRTARKYAADPIADEAGYERSVARTAEFLQASSEVFEFGCGTGTTALKLAPHCAHLLATDISAEMIAIAREKAAAASVGNVTFEVGVINDDRWRHKAFDLVLGFNILHLLEERQPALEAVHSLLKPGGLFISKTPCLTEMGFGLRLALPLAQAIGKAPHVDFFSEATLTGEITQAGFEIVASERHGTRGKDVRAFIAARKR